MSSFLHDAKRFVLNYRSIVESSPLQLYSSALIFAPKESIIRNTFQNYIPGWISQQPKVDLDWNAVLQTLEGHSNAVMSVAFSYDSKILASASGDRTVKVWDAATGSFRQTIASHAYITSLSFDRTDSSLLTNIGSITVDRARLPTTTESLQEGAGKGDSQGLGISGSWVTWNTQNLLWLPPDYRFVIGVEPKI